VTKTNHDGAQAPTACATGFHMASLWEILDPSHLAYDTILGGTAPDSGEGPPSAGGGGNFFGWIRTGTSSHGFGGPGSQNCKAYTSNVGGDLGTLIWPSQFWNNSPANPTVENLGFWLAFDGTCSAARKVWCVEDE
jgi:hypothetical protein